MLSVPIKAYPTERRDTENEKKKKNTKRQRRKFMLKRK